MSGTGPEAPPAGAGPRRTGRRFGYLVAAVVNGILLVVVNIVPGWQDVPWITDAAIDVVWLVNLSLAASLLANLLYMITDAVRFKASCQALIALVNIAAAMRILDVFPFDFSGYALPWALFVRMVLILAVVGSTVSLVVELFRIVRGDRPSKDAGTRV